MTERTVEEMRGILTAALTGQSNESIAGVEELTPDERDFLLVTACAEMIRAMVMNIAGGDRSVAMEGLQALLRDLQKAIGQ